MKSAVIALVAATAAAQATATKNVRLNDGNGVNSKASSKATVVVAVIPSISGTVVATQNVVYSNPAANNIVQSWMCFNGAADNGENLYAISNGTYGSDVSAAASIASTKRCGAAPTDMAASGS